jgi:hypothetical protein
MGAWTDADALSGAKLARGRGYLVARIAAPAAGDWRYRVVGEPHRDYLVSVRSDHASVRLALDDLPTLRVGEPIRIRARLDRSGVPVTDARPVAMVQALFVGSLDARLRDLSRNYLMTHKARPPVGAVFEKQADMSPRAALAQILGVNQQAEPVPAIRVPLKHESDGVYSGTLARHTQVAGIYRVTVKASGEDLIALTSRNLVRVTALYAHDGSELGSFFVTYDGAYLIKFSDPATTKQIRLVVDEEATSKRLLSSDVQDVTASTANIRYLLVEEADGLVEIGAGRDFDVPSPTLPALYTGIFTQVGKIERQ